MKKRTEKNERDRAQIGEMDFVDTQIKERESNPFYFFRLV